VIFHRVPYPVQATFRVCHYVFTIYFIVIFIHLSGCKNTQKKTISECLTLQTASDISRNSLWKEFITEIKQFIWKVRLKLNLLTKDKKTDYVAEIDATWKNILVS
jgi:hypothetical protein